MTKILIFYLFIVFAFKCESPEEVIINIIVENGKTNEDAKLTVNNKLYTTSFDSLNIATLVVKNLHKEIESEIFVGEYVIPVWL
ncbi:MAG: hypothetical protein LIO65_03610, partial [Odoribacter sp.]|nr:hypothetical protein [Odoribacter sp.]